MNQCLRTITATGERTDSPEMSELLARKSGADMSRIRRAAVALPLLLAGVSVPLTVAGPAGAVVTPSGVSQFSVNGTLSAISALTATDAWAVGQTANQRPLIVHWNGRSWK